MSCLTRKLQQNITQYLKKRHDLLAEKSIDNVRYELVNVGICPSHVTEDQMRDILRVAQK
ncbi:hypothetical protein [Aliiglaciecola sp. LCG003]|uniref:hypothetical protein n=1 Tax=Aliiglaciecola sp. LCG003 TaxID=3053655 RepID=UPI002573BD6E|nr:hypothetical protein [Aliiglaciecola sp. LCG003]WJG09413.1 hypothetical protein QR722_19120 [Aliiglaciecola sp. LCG003]